MVELLRKLFIKNYKNVEDPTVRQKHGFLASFVGIFSNLLLFVFKLLIGLIIFSMSIITDALNNLTDMASCIVNLVGFKLAGKPADKEHPFGHERIEYIAGLIVSFIIIAIAAVLGYTSVNKIINNEAMNFENDVYTIATFVILGAAILVKLWQGFFYRKVAKIISSVSLKANAQDSINDVITTSCVLIATIVEYCLRDYNIHIDGWMGVAVSLFIVIMGIKLVVETSNPLIGIAADHELVKKIVNEICSYDGVLGVHDVMAHSYGPTKIFMTIHVEVDSKTDIMQSHDLMDIIEQDIGNKFNVILTVHMDPIVTDSDEVNNLRALAASILNQIDTRLSFHDFRIVEGPTHTNILFDIVQPFDVKIKGDDIIHRLQEEFTKVNSTYFLVLKIDRVYVD